jgi:hypothetical protein
MNCECLAHLSLNFDTYPFSILTSQWAGVCYKMTLLEKYVNFKWSWTKPNRLPIMYHVLLPSKNTWSHFNVTIFSEQDLYIFDGDVAQIDILQTPHIVTNKDHYNWRECLFSQIVGGNRVRRWTPTQQPPDWSALLRRGHGRRPPRRRRERSMTNSTSTKQILLYYDRITSTSTTTTSTTTITASHYRRKRNEQNRKLHNWTRPSELFSH